MLNLVRIVCIWILGIDLMNTSPNWFEDLMNNVHCANDFLLWLFSEWSGKLLQYALFSHDNWIWCYMSFSWIVAMHENSLIYLVIGIPVELRLQENYLLAWHVIIQHSWVLGMYWIFIPWQKNATYFWSRFLLDVIKKIVHILLIQETHSLSEGSSVALEIVQVVQF